MNDETLKMLEKQQEDCIKNAATLDVLLDPDEKSKATLTTKESQKIELEERRMRVEESKLQLEYEKFKYQKRRDKSDNTVKLILGGLGLGGVLIPAGVEVYRIIKVCKNIGYCATYEKDGIWSGPTIRKVISDGTNLKC